MRPAIRVHLRGDDSDGHLALIEYTAAAGADGPPLHVHPYMPRASMCLKVVTFQTRDEVVTARGSILVCRRRNPHTFANLGERDARLLVTCTPAGFEGYFDRFSRRRGGSATTRRLPLAHQ